ncbi:uncharacterized protein LOC133923120 [Phragmites australis]|uniref:uncharacterized protein LOC133923120 n=1 Tax=Phragmites australis TaxID=29695 RepID=UPI002D79CDD2|nr:uncharacterized protein LOC133923120 [Phragmites australis]
MRAARSLLSSARSAATAASSRSITSQALSSTSGRGSGAWLDGGQVLDPLQALSVEALGVPDNCHAGAALAATTSTVAACSALGVLRVGSDGTGYSGAAATLSSGQGGACSFYSASALGSGAGAFGLGAGVGLGSSGYLWPPAGSLGSLKMKKVNTPKLIPGKTRSGQGKNLRGLQSAVLPPGIRLSPLRRGALAPEPLRGRRGACLQRQAGSGSRCCTTGPALVLGLPHPGPGLCPGLRAR